MFDFEKFKEEIRSESTDVLHKLFYDTEQEIVALAQDNIYSNFNDLLIAAIQIAMLAVEMDNRKQL